MFSFTEKAAELLIPIIRDRMKFLNALKEWKTIVKTKEEFASTCQNLEVIEEFPEDRIVDQEIEFEMPVGDNNFEPRYVQHIFNLKYLGAWGCSFILSNKYRHQLGHMW